MQEAGNAATKIADYEYPDGFKVCYDHTNRGWTAGWVLLYHSSGQLFCVKIGDSVQLVEKTLLKYNMGAIYGEEIKD